MLDDDAFDALLPPELRRLSRVHWSPAAVARTAAEWLVTSPATTVLDLGAGVGKLCCLGALHRGGRWHGIERVAACVEAATAIAATLELADRVTFQLGDIADLDWRGYDAIYLYNPFVDAMFAAPQHALVAETHARLAAQPAGTRIVTFHGYGAALPPGYRCAAQASIGLQLWVN